MRVISGRLGGRSFLAPKGHRTHPMSDKIRGALFNILGDVSGLTMLDAFSGSGGIAIEAISRGAASVVAIDQDKTAATVIKNNIDQLGLGQSISLFNRNALNWSNRHPDQQFDIVLLDPPFDKVLYTTLIRLTKHVKPGGTLVLSLPGDEKSFNPEGFDELARKSYGDAQLVFYRRIS